jgi:transcriptional regulator with XRE-family HTH domain
MTAHKGRGVSKKNLKYFTKSIAETLDDRQKKVIAQYESASKLRAVMRWKERMTRANLTSRQIALDVGIAHTRISEYINFKVQPKEEKYLEIESAIYNRGA